jgi:hypothetical protein
MALKCFILSAFVFTALHSGAQSLVFERTQINEIRLSEDDPATDFVFAFTSGGSTPAVITRVTTSCGCAVADYPKQPVAPGEKGEIKITYNPKDRAGKLARKVQVYVAGSTAPAATLELNGEITPTTDKWSRWPMVLGELRVRRNTVSFGAVSRTGVRKERIMCVNSGEKSLKLSVAMAPSWLSLYTEPDVIGPGEQADMYVVIDGPSIPAGVAGKVEYMLLIDGMDGRPAERCVRVAAEIMEE